MGLPLNMKKALTRELAPQYRKAGKKEKSKMLDEFGRHTGYNRKYALHLLTHRGNETFLTVDGKPVKLKAGTTKRGYRRLLFPRQGGHDILSHHNFLEGNEGEDKPRRLGAGHRLFGRDTRSATNGVWEYPAQTHR
jgi:hypothetical protein